MRSSRFSVTAILVCICLFVGLSASSVRAQSMKQRKLARMKKARSSGGAAANVSNEEKMKDWREAVELAKESEKVRWESDFKKDPVGFTKSFIAFNKKFIPFWERVGSKYKRDSRGRFEAFEGMNQPLDLDKSFSSAYNTLLSAVGKKKDVAEWCKSVGEKNYRNWKRNSEKAHSHKVELYLEYITTALNCFKAGKELSGDSTFDENIKIAQEAVNVQTKRFEENLHKPEMDWPVNNPKWKGPTSAADVCAAAMECLKEHPGSWGDRTHGHYKDDLGEPIAVSLASGDWNVFKTNILKQPTQYRLDMKVAFGSKSGSRFAYLFHYSFYTKNEAGIAKAPPFARCNNHDYAYYKMLASKVPGGGGGFGGGGGAGGWFWRLLLSVACIVAGLLAAAPMINKKAPALAKLYETLTPLRNILGVAAMAIGLICFVVALLHLAPFGNILPQVAAIVTGLFLGKELLMKKPPADAEKKEEEKKEEPEKEKEKNPDAPAGAEQVEAAMEAAEDAAEAAGEAAEKAALAAQDLLIKHKEKIEALEKYQVPMGIACLVLGVLHLLAGGFPLI